VIFMATLPLGQRGVDINLPAETKTAQQQQEVDVSQIMLDYTADRKISVNRQDVTIAELESRLRSIYEQRKDKTMFIAGAETLRYGDIIEVIDAAKGAGVTKVGIVTAAMRRCPEIAKRFAKSSGSSASRSCGCEPRWKSCAIWCVVWRRRAKAGRGLWKHRHFGPSLFRCGGPLEARGMLAGGPSRMWSWPYSWCF